IRLDGASYPPPQIRRPTDLQPAAVLTARGAAPAPAARGAQPRAHLGPPRAPALAPLPFGGTVAPFALAQGLVCLQALFDQLAECLVIKSRPPAATGRPAVRRHRLPAVLVAKLGGIYGIRRHMIRPQGAGRQQQAGGE